MTQKLTLVSHRKILAHRLRYATHMSHSLRKPLHPFRPRQLAVGMNLGCLLALTSSPAAIAQTLYWQDIPSQHTAAYDTPSSILDRKVTFNLPELTRALTRVEAKGANTSLKVTLPRPDGSNQTFKLIRSTVLPEALSQKFPAMHAYTGEAINDAQTTIQLEITANGVSAQILEPGNRWMIEPVRAAKAGVATSFFSKHAHSKRSTGFCGVHTEQPLSNSSTVKKNLWQQAPSARSTGETIRQYTIAVATTGEYGQYHGGTVEGALSAVVTTINRVSGILKREVAVELVLSPQNDNIIFTDPISDPFLGNDDTTILLNESQEVIDTYIGSNAYDIGHTLSTGGGGLASVNSACEDSFKAQGVTGSGQPEGDPFDVDYVTHEIGHQLGANHTYNGSVDSCTELSRYGPTAFEPGSGSTILSYAGLCGSDDLQPLVDPMLHSASFEEITAHVVDGAGASCGQAITTTNSAPTVTAGADYTVPKSTPLVVNGSATDNEQTALSYSWEQRDLGPRAPLTAPDDGRIPLFRTLPPKTSATRYLPSLSDVVAGTSNSAEKMPEQARNMRMRLTVRDGAGGVNTDDMVVTVIDTAGPFRLTAPTAGSVIGEKAVVEWSVANTNVAPINTQTVELWLSTDGGETFPTFIGTTANDGQEIVNFPTDIATEQARLMIKSVGNIFYAVSSADLTLDSNQPVNLDADADGVPDIVDAFPNDPLETEDTDGDGLGNNQEANLGTDPTRADSDNDGYSDGEEVELGSDPLNSESAPAGPSLPVWLLYKASQPPGGS